VKNTAAGTAVADQLQPNGSLGQSVLKHLANNGFNITLLTRDVGKTKQAFPGYITVQANYESQEELEKTLRNDVGKQDTLVILINREQPEAQNRLLDAAIAVGIKHVIPSSFGIGQSLSHSHASVGLS
jgi:Trk K+ transport system NAD-binding subunit